MTRSEKGNGHATCPKYQCVRGAERRERGAGHLWVVRTESVQSLQSSSLQILSSSAFTLYAFQLISIHNFLLKLQIFREWVIQWLRGQWLSDVHFRWGRNLYLVHNFQTGFGAQPGSCPVCTSVSSPREKRLERETDHSPPFCPRLIRNWVTYCHFPYIKSGSSVPAGQIHLLSFTYEFYSTLIGSLGQGIGHLQPSFYSVNYNREDKTDIQSKPYFFVQ